MEYSKIILLGKNTDDGFVFAKIDEETCNFEYINTKNTYVTTEGLIKDMLMLDKQNLSDILNITLENGINELMLNTDYGEDILSKVYPDFMAYTTTEDDSFILYEKTDKKIIFKEYFDKERFDKLLKAKDNKDKSIFESILKWNDLFDEVLNYEEYANEITSAEKPEQSENLKQDFLKEFEKLLQKYYNLDLTKFK